MKKMMFNDRYGLTEAVIQKRKTVTRRMITGKMSQCWLADCKDRGFRLIIENNNLNAYTSDKELYYSFGLPYKAGEIVAVAQCYYDALGEDSYLYYDGAKSAGEFNKMFVRADLMPHQIRILDIRAEKLQDITDDDCLREGIYKDECKTYFNGYAFELTRCEGNCILATQWYKSPREAFAALIDKISGKGTWKSNPFVWRIEFEYIN